MAKVVHQVGIQGNINLIYKAVIEPESLVKWWAEKADGNPIEGETINLHFSNVATLSFEIKELVENSSIILKCVSGPRTWENSDLSFNFNQDDNQTWVKLTHENTSASEEDFLYFSTKWTCYLLSLKGYIENGKGMPFPNDIKIQLGD
jgi:hypothetical protein